MKTRNYSHKKSNHTKITENLITNFIFKSSLIKYYNLFYHSYIRHLNANTTKIISKKLNEKWLYSHY